MNMDISGDCIIPQKKRNANTNDSAVELDKDGDNSVIEESEKIKTGLNQKIMLALLFHSKQIVQKFTSQRMKF